MAPAGPMARARLTEVGDTIDLPEQQARRVRLLVSARGNRPDVSFAIDTGAEVLEGTVRASSNATRSTPSTGKIGASRDVSRSEINGIYMPAALPANTRQLTLRSLEGAPNAVLEVGVYDAYLHRFVWLAIMVVALLGSALLDRWLGMNRRFAIPAAATLVFGLAVQASALPGTVVGPVVSSLLPSVALGVLVGFAAMGVVRPVSPRTSRQPSTNSGKGAARRAAKSRRKRRR